MLNLLREFDKKCNNRNKLPQQIICCNNYESPCNYLLNNCGELIFYVFKNLKSSQVIQIHFSRENLNARFQSSTDCASRTVSGRSLCRRSSSISLR